VRTLGTKVVGLVVSLVASMAPSSRAYDFEKDAAALRRIHEQMTDTIVTLDVVVRDRSPQGVPIETPQRATGVVHDAAGGVVGPSSLVAGAFGGRAKVISVAVTDARGERHPARLVGKAAELGLAFFRVDGVGFRGTPVELADDDTLKIGDFFATLRLAGPNFAHALYLDAFMVSARLDAPRCYVTTFAVSDYLGAPAVALDGRVVGLIGSMRLRDAPTASGSSLFAQPFGFADDGREIVVVPAERLRAVFADPPALPVEGESEPADEPRGPWLGVETQSLLPVLAGPLGFDEGTKGILVTRVHAGSPAERAGVQLFDAVLTIDDVPLDAPKKAQNRRFRKLVSERSPGDRMKLGIVRDGTALEVEVALAVTPHGADDVEVIESEAFGVTVRDLVYADRTELRLPLDTEAARLVTVTPTGFAGLGGLRAGDIVERVGEDDVTDARALVDRFAAAKADREPELVLFVRRGRSTQFVHVVTDW